MIPEKKNMDSGRPEAGSLEINWSDLEQIARRVMRAANLAVMAHAELDAFTSSSSKTTSAVRSTKKAG